MDYRPVPESHLDAFFDAVRYAFEPEDGPDFEERDGEEDFLFAPRARYDVEPETPDEALSADDLLAVCGTYELTCRVRDGWQPAGGVSVVATPPEHRRQGHVRELLRSLLAEYRDDGIPLAVLWPFEYGFYRRLGWGVVGQFAETSIAPGDLAGSVADPAGQFRRLEADDWTALDEVYDTWADETFALDRTETWWRRRVFEPFWGAPYVYGWEDDAGDLRGYLVYRVNEDDEKRMDVSELAYADDEARRQLLRFCRDHDSQVDAVEFSGPVQPRLFETLADPRAADVEVRPGAMVRVVDVAEAVETLGTPAGVDGSVAVHVEDDLCAWNDGTSLLSFADGTARCEPTEAEPAVSVDVGSLSQLVTGAVPAERLVDHGDLQVHDSAALDTLVAAYPESDCYLRENF